MYLLYKNRKTKPRKKNPNSGLVVSISGSIATAASKINTDHFFTWVCIGVALNSCIELVPSELSL